MNENGLVAIKQDVVNQPIAIRCQYNSMTTEKIIIVSYDNQLTIECQDTMSGTSANAVAAYNSSVV